MEEEGWADDGERRSDTDAYSSTTLSLALYEEGDRPKVYGVLVIF